MYEYRIHVVKFDVFDFIEYKRSKEVMVRLTRPFQYLIIFNLVFLLIAWRNLSNVIFSKCPRYDFISKVY